MQQSLRIAESYLKYDASPVTVCMNPGNLCTVTTRIPPFYRLPPTEKIRLYFIFISAKMIFPLTGAHFQKFLKEFIEDVFPPTHSLHLLRTAQ